MPWGTKNLPPKKNLSRGALSNWCDADADADAYTNISKICRPPPYVWVDIISDLYVKLYFQLCHLAICSLGLYT